MPAVTAAARALKLAGDPAVDGLLDAPGIEAVTARASVHLGEARRVPQLGGEVAIALDAVGGQLDVAALRGHGGQREAQRVGAVLVDHAQGVHDVALGLGHLLPLLVAHEGMDVDVVERDLLHEVEPHHHHARDPEEDDVEAGDEHAGGIEALELLGLLGPAERRERPQGGGEPGVEDVGVALKQDWSL